MTVPTQYLTTTKNLEAILDSIRSAKAPEKFTRSFLVDLGYKSSGDRLIIGVFKALKFLDADGRPLQRYYDYLDSTESQRVLAEALEEAYSDIYQVHKDAHSLAPKELRNKLKTITQGEFSDDVLRKMATTFTSLAKHANFKTPRTSHHKKKPKQGAVPGLAPEKQRQDHVLQETAPKLGGLVYNIQLILPESRDPAVYDALFRSLKEHLL